jgi:polyisoprenoid-binding protein YceI
LKSFAVEGSTVHLTGNLTIAGVTKPVKFKSEYQVKGSDVHFTGSYSFKMTDFGIDPPTAVMGTIKTGDEIVVRFDLVYRK